MKIPVVNIYLFDIDIVGVFKDNSDEYYQVLWEEMHLQVKSAKCCAKQYPLQKYQKQDTIDLIILKKITLKAYISETK
ncbi:hypothetical protein ACA081_00045 [Candidatus Hodgkinia cicadicola]